MKSNRKTAILRRLLQRGCVAMPGAFNAATARLIEKTGFSALYISGAGLANGAAGAPDNGSLSLKEVVQLAGYIAKSVEIPALADADTGFGWLRGVTQTIVEFEKAGLSGLHMEDQVFPKRCGHLEGKTLLAESDMCRKIRAAVRARKDRDFLIVARTDARSVEGFESSVHRAKKYFEAGADGIFPEALETADEFREFAKRMRDEKRHKSPLLLANMTEFGKSPSLSMKQLEKMGYSMVIFPLSAFRVSMKAEEQFLKDLKKRGSQKPWLPHMQTRKELYQLLDYRP